MTSTRDLKDHSTEDQHELERLRAEVAAWRARFDRGEKRRTGPNDRTCTGRERTRTQVLQDAVIRESGR